MEGTDADCRFGITTTPSSFGKKITGGCTHLLLSLFTAIVVKNLN